MEEQALQGKAGVPILLPLTVGPTTGYRWQLDLPPGVQRLADEQLETPPDRPGAHNPARLRVAAEPGDYTVRATLARPWEPENVARRAVFRLTVAR